jgi:hypothetical protein
MKNRSELPKIYYEFAQMIKTQFSQTIKIFRADNAMEYKETKFLNFLRQNGTLSQYSCPGTSQQNGRAERKHRHILDTVRTLLISSSCPEHFWGEAALTAVYTINRVPMPVIQNQSPYERLYGTPPSYDLLKVFGCTCFVLLQPHERNKLEPRARICCFLGYGIKHKGYRCWDPLSQRLRISRHVIFWEHKMFSSLSKFHVSSPSSPAFFHDSNIDLFPTEIDPSPSPTVNPEASSPPDGPATAPPAEDPPLRRSTRVSTLPTHLRDYHCFSTIMSHHEPQTYREASSNPHWQQAMKDEIQALTKAHTWDLVDLPSGKSLIGCKWIFKIKTHSDGSVD